MTAAAKRLIIFACACLSLFTLPQISRAAQENELLAAPPLINFDEWRLTESGESASKYEITFPSPVISDYEANNKVRLVVTVPESVPRPCPVVILLHFWGAADIGLENEMAARLAERGIASVVMPLPYHLTRTPAGYRSGELAIQPDPQKLLLTMSQSVKDIRRTLDWIESRPEFDRKHIGLSGTSLGSIVGATAYAIDSRISAASFLLGGVDLAHIIWNSSRVVLQRDALRSKGWTEEKLRSALEPIEPRNLLANTPRRPTYVIGARHDTVVPPRSTEELVTALDHPKELWLETGHYGGVMVQGSLIRTISQFFDATLHGRDFDAPQRLFAPTIRLGLNYNGEEGFQVAGGIDIWRLEPSGAAFASLLITPTGPQAFIGYSLTKELAIGLSASRRKPSWGVFWSIIL